MEQAMKNGMLVLVPDKVREREREREIQYVHSASLAYEDGIVFMSEPDKVMAYSSTITIPMNRINGKL